MFHRRFETREGIIEAVCGQRVQDLCDVRAMGGICASHDQPGRDAGAQTVVRLPSDGLRHGAVAPHRTALPGVHGPSGLMAVRCAASTAMVRRSSVATSAT